MDAGVRSVETTPVVADFAAVVGTPILVDRVTGACYILKSDETVLQIGGGGSFTAQSANRVFAGPTTGAAAVPAFRALVAADIPTLTLSKISDAGTIASQNANNVTITGGTINGAGIGGSTPASGTFTTLSATGNVNLGDAIGDTLTVSGNAITWSNAPTHSNNHIFSGFVTARGNVGSAVPSVAVDQALSWCPSIPVLSLINASNSAGSKHAYMVLSESNTLNFGFANDAFSVTLNAISVVGGSGGITSITLTGTSIILAGAVTQIELGNASDTTLTRASSGNVAVEGNLIYRAGGTDVPITDGGTGSSTAAGAATNLGLGTGDTPTFTGLNVGSADTTLTRAGAGDVNVEGNLMYRAGGTDVPVTDGGTGASTAGDARMNLGLGTAAVENTGTSGATVPLLNGSNSWSGVQTFTTSPVLPSFAVASLPDAAAFVRGLIYVPDETGGSVPAFSDGTNWRRVTDREIVS